MAKKVQNSFGSQGVILYLRGESAKFKNNVKTPCSCLILSFSKIRLGSLHMGLFVSSRIQAPQPHVYTFPILLVHI